MHVVEILEDRPVAGHAAQRGLPGVLVRVDEARQHNAARRVDDLCPGCVDPFRHRLDVLAFDQHIPAPQVPHGRVHADDDAAADEPRRHGDYLGTSPSLTLTFSDLSFMPAAAASSSSSTEKSTSS